MIVFALDPGYTTGYVIAELEKNEKGFLILKSILKDGLFKYPNFQELLRIGKDKCDVIVMEDFLTRPSFSGQINYSDRVIGAFEVLMPDKIIFQPPAAKSRYPDQRLKLEGYWDSIAKSPHLRDAYRHLLIFIEKSNQKKRPFKTVRRVQ